MSYPHHKISSNHYPDEKILYTLLPAAFDFDTYEINPYFIHTPEWSCRMMTYDKESGMLHFDYDDESDNGYLSAPTLELSADGGKATIKFEPRKDMSGLAAGIYIVSNGNDRRKVALR